MLCKPPVQNVLFTPLRSKPPKPLPAKGYKPSKRQQKFPQLWATAVPNKTLGLLALPKIQAVCIHFTVPHCWHLVYHKELIYTHKHVYMCTLTYTRTPLCSEDCSFSILTDSPKYFREGWEVTSMVRALTFPLPWNSAELFLKATG